MVIAVPGKHLFSFMDLGNLKFRFPKLHKFYIEKRYGSLFYKNKFLNFENGLVGDIEIEKSWHEHFSINELSSLLEKNGFHVVEYDGCGFFNRVITFLSMVTPFKFQWLLNLDLKYFHKSQIFMLVRKSV